MRVPSRATARGGLTLMELLIVIAVIAVLAAAIFPAIQHARETSRRAKCLSAMRQFGVALHTYNDLFGCFPPGMAGKGLSSQATLLPYIDAVPIWQLLDPLASPTGAQNAPIAAMLVPLYQCPSDALSGTADGSGGTNYAANFGTGTLASGFNGVFRPMHAIAGIKLEPKGDLMISAGLVSDGLSHTAAISELLLGSPLVSNRVIWQTPGSPIMAQALFAASCSAMTFPAQSDGWGRGRPWIDGNIHHTGYNHVLLPNLKSCTDGGAVQLGGYSAASAHPGGVNLLRADGHASFVIDAIDASVWWGLGSRNGGEVLRGE